ncbi:MAG: hypothetical protein KAH11_02250 [Rhodospirillales bacterium]|jgi:hypothetical protein|nr:hypothetical protein [Rhodospirillales bacterium]
MKPLKVSNDPAELYAADTVHLVYIGADNCPYCKDFEGWDLKEYSNSDLAKKVYFTWVRTARFQDTDNDEDWPDHLEWVRGETEVSRGTPRFLVLEGRDLKLNAFGTHRFKSEVIPLLSRLTG